MSMVPTLLVAIPFTVLVSFTLNILLREIGAQDLSGAGAALGTITQIGPIVTVLIVAGAGATAICADLGRPHDPRRDRRHEGARYQPGPPTRRAACHRLDRRGAAAQQPGVHHRHRWRLRVLGVPARCEPGCLPGQPDPALPASANS